MNAISFLNLELSGETLIVTPLRNIGSFAEDEIHGEWTDLLSRVNEPDVKHVVLDFGSMEYFGSNVLEFVVQLGKRLKAKDGRLAICNATPVGNEILSVMRFDRLYPVVATRADALKTVAGSSVASGESVATG